MLTQEKLKLIGAIASESGIPIKTIRYYDDLGLLKTNGRTEGGYRLFDSDVFVRLKFIKRAQNLGLSLRKDIWMDSLVTFIFCLFLLFS